MKRTRLFLILIFIAAVAAGCSGTDGDGGIGGAEIMIRFEETEQLKISYGAETDFTKGLAAYDAEGAPLRVYASTDRVTNLGEADVVCYAETDGVRKEFVRKAEVTYYGLEAAAFADKAPSALTKWTFRDTEPYVTGYEWSRYVVAGIDPAWNRFENGAGLIMHGSDTGGHAADSEGREDSLPNTMLYNRFALNSQAEKIRIYLSNNPYPDYNNLAVNYRITAVTAEGLVPYTVKDWECLKAPVPENFSVDTGWYNLLQKRSFIDLDVSAFAGREIILIIEQDSSGELWQVDFYRALGYNRQAAKQLVKESRDTLVVYDVIIEDNTSVFDGMTAKEWSALPADERAAWDFSSSDAEEWKIYKPKLSSATAVKQADGTRVSVSAGVVRYANKIYLRGDRLTVTASGGFGLSLLLPDRSIVELTAEGRNGSFNQSASAEEYVYDVGEYISLAATVLLEVAEDALFSDLTLQNVNGKVLWTIGDSIFHINYDMVSEIAAAANCALVTSNLSGTTISPCRMYEQSMVNLIKSGSFDELFPDGNEPTVILVERGINDLYEYAQNRSIAMGAADSGEETATITGAVNFCIDWLKVRFPNAEIVWCAPMWSAATEERAYEEYIPLLEEICASKGVKLINLYEDTGVNKDNYQMYLYDGTHPNENGKTAFKEAIIEGLTEER